MNMDPTRTLSSVLPDFEARVNTLMLQEVGASTIHATTVIAVLIIYKEIL